MSVFSESIYAESQKVELKEIDVPGIVDGELDFIVRENEEVKLHNRNGSKKVKKFKETQEQLNELIPKQIELAKGRRKLNQVIEAREKYLKCIHSKEEEDCSEFKEDLDKFNIGTSAKTSSSNEFGITNSYIIKKIRQCSQITQDSFPGFRAAVQMDFTIDEQGQATSAYINEDESEISHDLIMFSKCVEHFAQKLNFKNESGKSASFKKNFIFG